MSATTGDGGSVGDVAVVVVEHNTRDLLAACLASLFGGGLDALAAEVWVVDNASTDGGLDMVRERFPRVHALACPGNDGYAAANNRGLAAAGFAPPPAAGRAFRHALLLNPDTVVPRGAVRALVDALEAEDDLGAVGPKLLLPDGSLDLACRRSFPTPEVSFYRFTGLSRALPRSRRFGRYNLTYLDPDAPADVDSVVGACMLVRGAAIADVGLLDERFWMYGEDLDWALRMRQAGWRVAYRPGVVVHHVKRAASRSSPRARYEFQRAMWLFYRKHYAASTAWPVHVIVLAALAVRGGPRLWREMAAQRGAP
jgi:N-acetylglucosaminyl-diphospho-decaprenol L-rhamnosyltransferase